MKKTFGPTFFCRKIFSLHFFFFLLQNHFLGNNLDEKNLGRNCLNRKFFCCKIISSETGWKNFCSNFFFVLIFFVEIFLLQNHFLGRSLEEKNFGQHFFFKFFFWPNFFFFFFVSKSFPRKVWMKKL